MNDHATDGTTMEPENKQKGAGRKRKYIEEKNCYSGYCVICEKELLRIRDHKADTHKDTDVEEVNTAIPEASEYALIKKGSFGVTKTFLFHADIRLIWKESDNLEKFYLSSYPYRP
ncbi:Hypothetical predicted protein [Cloeon dipterum]|uniref:Uncharacterized protein n=1 Tax=Cloeon dipterum TaxID=197152 RepID=A0A8S1DIK5_9INSE|nr:Hypothetical predicted protein [Cloeon dipterum]